VAIKIPFLADVAGFLSGTRSVEQALDEVADSLDGITTAGAQVDTKVGDDLESVAREADTSAEKLERSYKDAFRAVSTQADTSAEKLERSFKDAFRAVEAQGRTSTRKVVDDVDDVGRKGSATLDEFKDEAKQNVAESVSSFTGSADSAVDAIQSTFGGLVSALGPAGVLGAAAAAAGIGLARGLFAKSQEQAQKTAEAVATLAGSLIEAGQAAPGFDQINDQLKMLATTAASVKFWKDDGARTELDKLAATASKAGVTYADFALGVAGDAAAIARAQNEAAARVAELDQAEQDLMHTQGTSQQQVDDLVASHLAQREALGQVSTQLGAQQRVLDATTATVARYNEVQQQNVDHTKAVNAAAKTSIGSQNAAALAAYGHAAASDVQAAAAGGAAEEIERKTAATEAEAAQSLAASNAAIAYEQAVDDATAAVKRNGETHDLNTAAGRANQTALNQLAGTLVAVAQARQDDTGKTRDYNKVIDQNRREFIDAARAAGYSKTAAGELADQYGLIPKTVKTKVTDDGTAKSTAKEIDDTIPSSKTVGVHVKYEPSQDILRQIQRHLNSYTFTVGVNARPGKPV
jgi:hypothetical protein